MFGVASSFPANRLPRIAKPFLPGFLWPLEMVTFKNAITAGNLMISQVLHITVLITFGLSCPPLSLAIGFVMLSELYLHEVYLYRCLNVLDKTFISNSNINSESSKKGYEDENDLKSKKKREYVLRNIAIFEQSINHLNNNCSQTWKCPKRSIWIVVCMSGVYIYLSFVDIVGDEVGMNTAIKMASVIPGIIILYFFVLKFKSMRKKLFPIEFYNKILFYGEDSAVMSESSINLSVAASNPIDLDKASATPSPTGMRTYTSQELHPNPIYSPFTASTATSSSIEPQPQSHAHSNIELTKL